MPKVFVRHATQEDVDYIADHLREADVIELRLSQPDDPAEAVRKSFGWSNWTKVVLVDGVPAILYGVSPTDVAECGSPWMLATDGIRAIKRKFLLGSKCETEVMKRQYPFLFNQVHRGNALSIKWLKWLGFNVDHTPAGPRGEFFNFWMGVPNV